MKKIIIPLFCLFLFSAAVPATAQTTTTSAAKIDGAQFKFKDGDTYDFGEIPSGPDVTHDFLFTNVGNQPLTIVDAKPSCSCTTPEWPKDAIAPGATGTLKVGYHTTKSGPFYKEVYIQSNAYIPTGERRYTIYIKGVVK